MSSARYVFEKLRRSLNNPGCNRSMIDQSSERLFSTGVPVKPTTNSMFRVFAACVLIVVGVFSFWIWSKTTRGNRIPAKLMW